MLQDVQEKCAVRMPLGAVRRAIRLWSGLEVLLSELSNSDDGEGIIATHQTGPSS